MRTTVKEEVCKTLQTAAAFAGRAEVDLKIGIDELNRDEEHSVASSAATKALRSLNEAAELLEDFLSESI